MTIVTGADSTMVSVIYGDFFNETTMDDIKVTVYYKKGTSNPTVFNKKSVTIKRVFKPFFQGPPTVQECCLTPFTIHATDYGDANNFTWSATGGGAITGGLGTNTVTITPTNTGNITLNCTARRSSGLTQYSRSNATTITRTPPATQSIQGPDFFCMGESYQPCIDTICGQSGTNWNIPSTMQIISGQGTNCIAVTPKSSTANGTTVNIYATAVMAGGCSASNSPVKTFKVYSSGAPPAPQGYITLDLDSGDPCNDPAYVVTWHPTVPFVNGITTVSPGIVLGVGHHQNPNGGGTVPQVKITVCNINLCSGQKSCIYFYVDRPYPCEGLSAPGNDGSNKAETADRKAGSPAILRLPKNIEIYPNPSTGKFFLTYPGEAGAGVLTLFNGEGTQVFHTRLGSPAPESGFPESSLPKGIYFVQIKLESETFTRKIIVQ